MINIDLKNLPSQAIEELQSFYEYLLYKYKKNNSPHFPDVQTELHDLSWKMGEKLYKHRDDLYER
jgi:hypothetical protein